MKYGIVLILAMLVFILGVSCMSKKMPDHSKCGKGMYTQAFRIAKCGHPVPNGGLMYCAKCAALQGLCPWCGQKSK